MILKEFFYFDKETGETSDNDRYDPKHDTSVLQPDDTRKTRLTLKQINELRRITDQHVKEQELELEFIARMYSTPATQEGL